MAQESSPIPHITQIEDGLYLGDGLSSRRPEILRAHHIGAVVSLSNKRWVHWRQPWYKEIVPEGHHLYLPCNDSTTQDLLPELAHIYDFIQGYRDSGVPVLVHCDRGVSRSATAMIAYLMRAHQWSFSTALAFVESKRRIKPNDNFKEQLQVWETVGYDIWKDLGSGIPNAAYAVYLTGRAARLQARGLTGDEPVGVQSL